jgi:hypothetical protein
VQSYGIATRRVPTFWAQFGRVLAKRLPRGGSQAYPESIARFHLSCLFRQYKNTATAWVCVCIEPTQNGRETVIITKFVALSTVASEEERVCGERRAHGGDDPRGNDERPCHAAAKC